MSGFGMIATLLSVALTESSDQADNATAAYRAAGARDTGMTSSDKPPGSGNLRRLPTSSNPRDFASLDDYLAQLRRLGTIGRGWYRQIGPDSYELVTNMSPPPPRRTFTRAELMRQFGFTR